MTASRKATRPVIDVAFLSDPGRDPSKQVNEDACAYRDTRVGHLLVVCDGMGGHEAGQEASNLAVQTILAMVEGAPEGLAPAQVLKGAIEQAGRAVYQLGGPGPHYGRPGSTVVALLIHDGGTEVAHVGDSRAYCIRGGEIHALTRDHSMVQQMIDAGFLRPEEAYGHPDANKITRALGLRETTDVELRPEPVAQEAGDIFLLATDGLWDVARPEEARDIVLSSATPAEACAKLVELANARGGPDNVTAMVARVVEPGLRVDAPQRTQLGETLALDQRATVVEYPSSPFPQGRAGATLKETLTLGTPPDFAKGATLVDDVPPPLPDEPRASLLDGVFRPSHRGSLFLALGIGAVCLILVGIAIWWVVARRSPKPAPTAIVPIVEVDAGAVFDILPEPAVSASPTPTPPSSAEPPRSRGPWPTWRHPHRPSPSTTPSTAPSASP